MTTVQPVHSPVQPEADQRSVERSLGLPQSTALIMGSIIGVGIFSLPYSLASYGPISLVAMGPGDRWCRRVGIHVRGHVAASAG
jgi:hypothetical protein